MPTLRGADGGCAARDAGSLLADDGERGQPDRTWLPEQPIGWAHAMLGMADDLYVAGYRARDDIFAEMLKTVRNGTRLHVVGRGDGAREIAERVAKEHPKFVPGTIYDGGFQAYVEAGSP